jgi:hypothetical protein
MGVGGKESNAEILPTMENSNQLTASRDASSSAGLDTYYAWPGGGSSLRNARTLQCRSRTSGAHLLGSANSTGRTGLTTGGVSAQIQPF